MLPSISPLIEMFPGLIDTRGGAEGLTDTANPVPLNETPTPSNNLNTTLWKTMHYDSVFLPNRRNLLINQLQITSCERHISKQDKNTVQFSKVTQKQSEFKINNTSNKYKYIIL